METSVLPQEQQDKRRSRALLLFLAVLVALATLALLTKPGQAKTHTKKVLDCPLMVHEHTKKCYDKDGNLTCGSVDYVVHVHNDDCRDENGELVCRLPEIKEHKHTDKCFKEEKVLICGLEESEGHKHTDKCYEKKQGKLICDLEEDESHQHTDECYEWTEELVCGLEESEGHKHTDKCYEVHKVAICGELELHTHTKDCYDKDGNLICGQLELLEHVHGPECFREVELTEEEVAALNADEALPESSAASESTPALDDGSTAIAGQSADAAESAAGSESSEASEADPGTVADTENAAQSSQDTAEAEKPQADASTSETGAESARETPAEEADPAQEPAPAQETAPDEKEASAEERFTKVYRDKEVEVTVEYTAEAQIPEAAELRVSIPTEAEIREVQGGQEPHQGSVYLVIGFFLDGEEIEPQSSVKVHIRYLKDTFRNEENLIIRHYGREGTEEIKPQVKQNPTGDTEAVFDTSSFSTYEMVPYVSTATALSDCAVPGCNGKCNVYWTVYSDGTAKLTKINESAQSYHIHDKVYYNGVAYQVTDLSKLDDCCHFYVRNKELIIDDELAGRMAGNQTVQLPNIVNTIQESQTPELEGCIPGESNGSSSLQVWKKAGYDSEGKSATITLKFFQKMKQNPSVDFVFVYDDTCTMWDNTTSYTNPADGKTYSARRAVYQRAILQVIAKSLLNNSSYSNLRVAFIPYTDNKAPASPFFQDYNQAKKWIQENVLGRGCTHYLYPLNSARALIQSQTNSAASTVIWLGDFQCHADNRPNEAAALRETVTDGVFTITVGVKDSDHGGYGYANAIATLDPNETVSMSWGALDPTHMFKAADMDAVMSSVDVVVKELIGYYISKDTVVTDGLSSGLAPLALGSQSGDSVGKKANSSLQWTFLDSRGNRLPAGVLYTHTFNIPLDGKAVYSGDMPTNTTVEVKKGGVLQNKITTSPVLAKDVVLNAGKLDLNGDPTDQKLTNVTYVLKDSDNHEVWRGTTDQNGRVSIPYGTGEGQVQFPKNSTYTLEQQGDAVEGTFKPDSTWTLNVGNDYKITSLVTDQGAKTTPPMTVSNGEFQIWNEAYYEYQSPLTPLLVQKVWDGTVPEEQKQSIRFQVYGVKNDNTRVLVTAYAENDRSSQGISQITAEDRYIDTQDSSNNLDWARVVYVPENDKDQKPFKEFTVTEGDLQVLPSATLAGEGAAGSWQTADVTYSKASKVEVPSIYPEAGYYYVSDYSAYQNNAYVIFSLNCSVKANELRFDVHSSSNSDEKYVLIFSLGEQEQTLSPSYYYCIPFQWKNTGALTIDYAYVNGYLGYRNSYEQAIYYYRESQVRQGSVPSGTQRLSYTNSPPVAQWHDPATEPKVYKQLPRMVRITNSFQSNQALTISSTFNDDSLDSASTNSQIVAVSYTIFKDGEEYDTYTVTGENGSFGKTILVPPGTYTATQDSYTLKSGAVIRADEEHQFNAYTVASEGTMFQNTRRTFDAKVQTTWEPELRDYEDPLNGDAISYHLEYLTGSTQQNPLVTGWNSKANGWQMSHEKFPGFRVDGLETSCVLSEQTVDGKSLAEAIPDYVTVVSRSLDEEGNLVFTIANNIRRGEIVIRKRWKDDSLAPGQSPEDGHSSVTVRLTGEWGEDVAFYDVLGNRITEATLTPENNWRTVVYAPVKGTYQVKETMIDGKALSYSDDHSAFEVTCDYSENGTEDKIVNLQEDKGAEVEILNERSAISVYWVERKGGTLSALPPQDASWYGHSFDTITLEKYIHSFYWRQLHSEKSSDSLFRLPPSLKEQNSRWRLSGIALGPSYGTLSLAEAAATVKDVSVEDLIYSAPDADTGFSLIRRGGKLCYAEGAHADANMDYKTGETDESCAIYVIYEEVQPLVVRKVWNDKGTARSHDNDTITFTVTPQGGTALINPVTNSTSFQLPVVSSDEQGNEVKSWELMLDAPAAGSYIVSEEKFPGYGTTYQSSVETISITENGETAQQQAAVITITNIEGAELPATGGPGTYLYTIGGSAILAGGLLYGLQLWRRREGAAE